jgi:hypothetical protein
VAEWRMEREMKALAELPPERPTVLTPSPSGRGLG